MAKMNNLSDLMVAELQDVYDAEHQIVEALPKMAQKASSAELKAGFQQHLEESREHIRRLEQAFSALNQTAKRKTCKAMKGLIKEGEEMMEEDMNSTVMDAALIASAQRVEHYEMAAYGTLRTYANLIGHDQVSQIFQRTLEEEELTDKKLSKIASTINAQAIGSTSTTNGTRTTSR